MPEIDINPTVVLSLDGLKKALSNKTVVWALSRYCSDRTDAHRDALAAEIALASIPLEVFPQDRIEVHFKGGKVGASKAKYIKVLARVEHRMDLVRDLLLEAEKTYRDNMFARHITEADSEYRRLVPWVDTMEAQYQTFVQQLPEGTTIEAEEFFAFVINRSYEEVNRKGRMSVSNLAAVDVQNAVGVKLSKWLRALADPHRDFTVYMCRQVAQVFGITEDLIHNYEYYDRIRGGLSILLDRFFPDVPRGKHDQDRVQMYIDAWVMAQFEAFESFPTETTGQARVRLALGFVGGNTKEGNNTALARLEARVRATKQSKGNPEGKAKITTAKKKKRSRKISPKF